MTALQSTVVNHEAKTYGLFRRVCPDCHTFRPVKDYTMRRIRTVFGTIEVPNPRWMLCQDCHPGMAAAFAPLKEICPDRATSELMELTARLGSMMPYRQAASVLAEFLPIEPTETHATVRKWTIKVGERLDDQITEETWRARMKMEERHQLWRSTQRVRHQHRYGARSQPQSQFSAKLRARRGQMRSRRSGRSRRSPPTLTNPRYAIERSTLFRKRGIAALGMSP
ncbi:hypothetical protein EN759_39655 [Mesorhizobium sp. M00.F.Ca.ET.038.03.1.1]|nr:hypothetical protein EN759_39655 [Mesorhizobium sp. M00.F.Ca.ET.038.03.1.1]